MERETVCVSVSSVITSFITLQKQEAAQMSDTGFDGQKITAGTGFILSPASPLPPASLFTIARLTDVQAFHVAAFIKDLQGACSPPTVKQHLAALRMLFDWLVTGHVLEVNPAHAVRGPKYVVRKGKTPVLTAGEARELLGSIGTVRTTKRQDGTVEGPSLVGLRDRALIAAMVYTFARVNAVLKMKVRDFFVQGRRGWVAGCTRKGARSMKSPATTTWSGIWTNTSPAPASRRTWTRPCSRPRSGERAGSRANPCGSRTPTA